MVDWAQLIGFEWDGGNVRKNAEKHGVSQSEAEQVYFNQPLLIVADENHSHSESRYHAMSKTDNARLLHTTFTLCDAGTRVRVISARNMHRKERAFYEQNQKDT